MSDAPAPGGRQKWWLRPTVALPAMAVVIAVFGLLTPRPQDARDGDSRLTTYSAAPQGARLLYELADRLGWEARRHVVRGLPADTNAIVALLDPPVPITPGEAHAILEHVRAGGALLYVVTDGGPLNDSLGVRRGFGQPAQVRPEVAGVVDDECSEEDNGALPMWSGDDMHLWGLRVRPADRAVVRFVDVQPNRDFSGTDTTMSAPRRDDDGWSGGPGGQPQPAAVGFPLGAGRVVAISDPDLLRNDVLRVCYWAADVATVRMLEYLSPGGRRPIVFDEFHQGEGDHPGTFTAIARFFSRTPPGHVLAQLMLAGLVLLFAYAPRLVPPRDAARIERRSPTEHVQALARAYEKVGASRTAVLRLLHGLRRRVSRQGPPPIGEDGGTEALLEWIVRRAPATVDDVAVVRQGLARPVASRDLVRVAAAIRRIELALTQPLLAGLHPTRRAGGPPVPITTT